MHSSPDAETDSPLSGVRVIDFTMALAGPLSTMFLADMGADVIKVEDVTRPESLEMMRVSLNRNKRSISIDLKSKAGQQVARDLIASADVVVSSFRPGVMASFGLGASDLLADRPELIYASFSGYGETGPHAHLRSMDKIVQAESGMMSIGPMVDQVALVDITAGSSFASAIVAALFKRQRTGRGGRVYGRLIDAGLLLQAPSIASHSYYGSDLGYAVAGYPVADMFETSDGAVFLAAYYDWHWQALCRALGIEPVATDPRFESRELRTKNADELREVLNASLSQWRRDELVAALNDAGVMVTAVRGYDEVFEDPQLAVNQTLIDSPYRDGVVKLVRPPFSFDDAPVPFHRPTPELGGDTVAVLKDLGYEADRVGELLSDKAVHQAASEA